MCKIKSKRKGFTLIEVLVVIVITGILASMVLISSTETINAADTTAIIDGLKTISNAALMCYLDNPTAVDDAIKQMDSAKLVNLTKPYLKNPKSLVTDDSSKNTYHFAVQDGNWWVYYALPTVTAANQSGSINERLENRAEDVGLISAKDWTSYYTATDATDGVSKVCMLIK